MLIYSASLNFRALLLLLDAHRLAQRLYLLALGKRQALELVGLTEPRLLLARLNVNLKVCVRLLLNKAVHEPFDVLVRLRMQFHLLHLVLITLPGRPGARALSVDPDVVHFVLVLGWHVASKVAGQLTLWGDPFLEIALQTVRPVPAPLCLLPIRLRIDLGGLSTVFVMVKGSFAPILLGPVQRILPSSKLVVGIL